MAGFLNSPIADFGLMALSQLVNAAEHDKARKKNEALQASLEGDVTGFGKFLFGDPATGTRGALRTEQAGLRSLLGTQERDILSRYDRDTANLRPQLDKEQSALTGDYDRGTDTLMGAARKRQSDVLGLLKGMGDQEKADIRRDFEGLRGQTQANLTNRGLAGSSMLPSLYGGIQRRQSEALGAANERIRGQKATALSNLSGDVLNLQGARTSGREALTGGFAGQRLGFEESRRNQALNMASAFGDKRFGLETGILDQNLQQANNLFATNLNVKGAQNIGYPDQNALLGGMQALGQFRGAQQYLDSLPSAWTSFWRGAGQNVLSLGVGLPLAGAVTGGLGVGLEGLENLAYPG